MINGQSFLKFYFFLLILGPIIYIGKFPATTYQLAFLGFFALASARVYTSGNVRFFLPLYFRLYLLVLCAFFISYVSNFYESDYIASIRDLLVIFTPLQYIVLIALIAYVVQLDFSFVLSFLKFNLYLAAIVGLGAVFQMLDICNAQEILAKYYGKSNVDIWRSYFMYNPRASSTMNLEPNSLGLYSAISLTSFHIFSPLLRLSVFRMAIIFVLTLMGLLLSGSFTGVTIYILLTSVYLIVYKKIGLKFGVVLSLLVFIIPFFAADNFEQAIKRQKLDEGNVIPSSIKARMNNAWSKSLASFEEEYLNGIGPSIVQLDYSADNDFIDKFLRFGIFCGFLFSLFVIFLVVYPLLIRTQTKDDLIRRLLLFSSLISLAFLLASITGSAFKAKRLAELFWVYYSLPFLAFYQRGITCDER